MKDIHTVHVKWLEEQLSQIESEYKAIEQKRVYLQNILETATQSSVSAMDDEVKTQSRSSRTSATSATSNKYNSKKASRNLKSLKFAEYAEMNTLNAIFQCLKEAGKPLNATEVTLVIYNCETNEDFIRAKKSLQSELYRGEKLGKLKSVGKHQWQLAEWQAEQVASLEQSTATMDSDNTPINSDDTSVDYKSASSPEPSCFEDVLEESVKEMATELEEEAENGQVDSDHRMVTNWEY